MAIMTARPPTDEFGSRLEKLRRSGLVLVLALVVVVTGFSQSASAAVTGLGRVIATSDFSSSDKSVTARCPAGKQLLGAGGEIVGAGGQVGFEDITPSAALTSVVVRGREDQNGHAFDWVLSAYAICATAPPGLERVVATSATSSADKSVTAVCPAGKRLLGTGADRTGGAGQVTLTSMTPNAALTSVTASAAEDLDGTLADWSLNAYAICANPVAGRERISAPSALDSSSPKPAVATCPAGKQLTGIGGRIGGGGGEVVFDDLIPADSLQQVNLTSYEVEGGTPADWSASSYAICVATSRLVADFSNVDDSSSPKTTQVDCPVGTRATGAGGDITGALGQAHLDSVWRVGPSTARAVAYEDANAFDFNWSLNAYAICATPLPGLTTSSSGPSGSVPGDKTFGIDCPPGTRVVNAGGGMTGVPGYGGQVFLTEFATGAGLTRVTVAGQEQEGGAAFNWDLYAYAVCATRPPGLELVSVESEPQSDVASAIARCPRGKNLLGVGARISGGGGQVVLDDARPDAALTGVTVTALEDENGYSGTWSVVAQAICADP